MVATFTALTKPRTAPSLPSGSFPALPNMEPTGKAYNVKKEKMNRMTNLATMILQDKRKRPQPERIMRWNAPLACTGQFLQTRHLRAFSTSCHFFQKIFD
ncbi:hypothetical protein ACQT3V_00885 [Brucella sp. NF 2653]|uniref:hypothetical protein n=1 Tax=Brucella sp. NF 2653 TaxID=693748 RepID=UPI003D0FB799